MRQFVLRSGLAALLASGWLAGRAQAPEALRLQAFAQGGAANCVSVALIKAAIQRYGVGQVFDTVRTDSTVRVVLRDHTVLTLTDAERQRAASQARFQQGNPPGLPPAERAALLGYAHFCYAVLAKYLATQRLYLCTDSNNQPGVAAALGSYQQALAKLSTDGICSDNAYRHLGLRAVDPTAPPYRPDADFTGRPGVVAYSRRHAVLVLGRQYDHYGTWYPLARRASEARKSFRPSWFFELAPASSY